MRPPKPYWRKVPTKVKPEPQPDFFQKLLQNPVVILSFVTAILYFHGQALYSGYLSYWGLCTQLFPISFEETLMHGAWTYLLVGAGKWKYLLGLLFYVFILYGTVFLITFKRPMERIKKIVQTKVINDIQKQFIGEVTDSIFRFTLIFGLALLVFIISLLAARKGKDMAEAVHSKIHQPAKIEPFKTVTLDYLNDKNSPSLAEGTMIMSSATMFAIHTDANEILLVPTSRLVSVQYHDKVKSEPTPEQVNSPKN